MWNSLERSPALPGGSTGQELWTLDTGPLEQDQPSAGADTGRGGKTTCWLLTFLRMRIAWNLGEDLGKSERRGPMILH